MEEPTEEGTPPGFFSVGKPKFEPYSTSDRTPLTWTEPPASEFMVRGLEYLKQKEKNVVSLKQPSAESPYQCIGVNVFQASQRLVHSADSVNIFRKFLEENQVEEEDGLPKYLVCWLFSNFWGTENTLVHHLFERVVKAKGEDAALDAVADRFFGASDEEKNCQFKYMFRVITCPPLMKVAVDALGGERPVLIGKRLTTTYYRGKNYFEINMDVGSSTIASMLHSTIMKTSGSAVVDECWLFESQQQEELPERVLAKVRWNYCDPSVLTVHIDEKGDIIS